jgi:hypothetical protein
MRRTVTTLATAALGLTLLVPASAQEAAIAADEAANAVANSVAHVLVATLIDQSANARYTLPNGNTNYTFAQVTTFTCAADCTLEMAVMVQAGANRTAGNSWSICGDIDKETNLLACPFQSALPTDRSYVVGNYAWSVPLAAGTHKVQPTVYVKTGAAGLGMYHIAYRVYQP